MNSETQASFKNGVVLAREIIARFQTQDPFELARLAGVRLSCTRWHPVTWGEYDLRSRSICLNLAAPVPLAEVLAHELGHYFSQQEGSVPSRVEEEKIAKDFAWTLLQEG